MIDTTALTAFIAQASGTVNLIVSECNKLIEFGNAMEQENKNLIAENSTLKSNLIGARSEIARLSVVAEPAE
jgi:hypothetical protein